MEHEFHKRDISQELKFQGVVEVKLQITIHFKDLTRIFFDPGSGGGVLQIEVNRDLAVKRGLRKMGRIPGQPKHVVGLTKTEWNKEEEPFSKFGGNRILTFRVRKSALGFNNAIKKMFTCSPDLVKLQQTTPLCASTAVAHVVEHSETAAHKGGGGPSSKCGASAPQPLVSSASACVSKTSISSAKKSGSGGANNKRAREPAFAEYMEPAPKLLVLAKMMTADLTEDKLGASQNK
jgi:hypothetical protein